MVGTEQVHHQVPELRWEHDRVRSFAAFCRYLATDGVQEEADALVAAADALFRATTAHLAVHGQPDEDEPPSPPAQRRPS